MLTLAAAAGPLLGLSELLALAAVALVLAEWACGWRRRRSKQRAHTVPAGGGRTLADVPGPLSLPWLGSGWLVSALGPYTLTQLHRGYHDLKRRYGPIVRLEALGNVPILHLFAGSDIEHVARSPARFPTRPPTEITVTYRRSRPDRYASAGFVNEQGEQWGRLRQALTKEITSTRSIARILPDLERLADDFAELLRSRRDASNRVPGIDLTVKHLGLECTSTLVLGRRLGTLDREVQSLGARLAKVVELHFGACRDSYFGLLPLWKYLPTSTFRRYRRAEEEFYDIIQKLVEDALVDEQDTCATEPIKKIFMSILHAEGLDPREKKAAIIDFIAAGIVTLGNTVLFTLYHVAKNPHVQKRLYEELTSLQNGKPRSIYDLRTTPYLHAVVQETYRLQPTAIHIARIIEEDMLLSNYNIPAGTVVLCHNWEACLEESNFTHANEFRPERWMPGECPEWKSSPKLLAPFGFGRRKCPGEHFANQITHLLLSKMVLNFRMEYEGELETKFEFLLIPDNPFKLILHDHE